ncbi:MAG: hypothetical protein EPN26_17035 [Rhodospirillales bacterium]|nr:MAG: hypothetical protein EPN26_17035 [Rhodospirillales bacterium]
MGHENESYFLKVIADAAAGRITLDEACECSTSEQCMVLLGVGTQEAVEKLNRSLGAAWRRMNADQREVVIAAWREQRH